MNLADVFRNARLIKGWSRKELARHAQVDPSVVTRIEKGQQVGRADSIARLGIVLSLPSDVIQRLLVGEDVESTASPDRTPEEIATELAAALRRDREKREREQRDIESSRIEPLTGHKILILRVQPQSISADTTQTGYVADEVSFIAPEDADPDRYQAFRVVGDCLRGRVDPGSWIVVDCYARPEEGDVVAVSNGDLLVKIWEVRDGGEYLTALNGQPPIRATDVTHIIGVVVQVTHKP